MKNKIATVLVTAIGGAGHGEQIVKALRIAPDTQYRIIGGDAATLCAQFSMVDQPVVMPKASDPSFINAILALCNKYGVCAVFHGCEPELLALSKARNQLADVGVLLPVNPQPVIDICSNKEETSKFLAQNGFGYPHTLLLRARCDVDSVKHFPVVVKPISGGGSQDCYIAQSHKELEVLFEYLQGISGSFIVQEYIGTYEDEYTVGVLHDMDGNFINSIAVRRKFNSALNIRTAVRNRTRRAELGEWLVISSGISHGQVGRFRNVTEPCERIAAVLGARGAINFQCRLVNGDVKVFEINPRFSGTTSLRAMMGYNEPDILIRKHIFGERVETRFSYREGWILRSLCETVLPDAPVPLWATLVT